MPHLAGAPERQLGAYAVLTGVYVAGIAAAAAAIERRRGLPERVDWQDLALIAIATQKLVRDITHDKVTAWMRAPFSRHQGKGQPGEEESVVVGRGMRRAVGQLLVCPFCIGEWIGAGFVVAHPLAPRRTRFVASILAVHGVADFLQVAYLPQPSAACHRPGITRLRPFVAAAERCVSRPTV